MSRQEKDLELWPNWPPFWTKEETKAQGGWLRPRVETARQGRHTRWLPTEAPSFEYISQPLWGDLVSFLVSA